jgi:hypothetical protein
LFGAGTLVVLALALGLVQMTRGAAPAAPVPGRPAASTEAPVTAPAAADAPVARPSVASAPVAPRAPAAPSERRPELVPAPVGFDRELKRDANGNLVPVIPVSELRAQLELTTAPMKECLERSGQRPTGKATLHFTVAAKNNKLVIESTGVQDQETLTASPALLECMHKTANVFALEGRPVHELGTPIYVRRHVQIENGELTENSIFDFSYSH